MWALRGGGGGNFGIVTEFVFKVHPMPQSATYFEVRWPWSSADEAIEAWQSWAPTTTDKITSILHLESAGPSIEANGQYLGSSGDIPGLARPLLEVPGADIAGERREALPRHPAAVGRLRGQDGRRVPHRRRRPRGHDATRDVQRQIGLRGQTAAQCGTRGDDRRHRGARLRRAAVRRLRRRRRPRRSGGHRVRSPHARCSASSTTATAAPARGSTKPGPSCAPT